MNNDILSIVLSLLDIHDITNCSLINRRFNKVADSEHLYYALCNRDYIEHYETLKQNTFRETYKLCFSLDKLHSKLEIGKNICDLYHLDNIELYNNQIIEILGGSLQSKRRSDQPVRPKEICQLVNLQLFYLHNNEITEIPKEIYQLVNLQWLYLHNNEITEIPKEICQLVNLRELDLSNNQINEIPLEIGQLVNLQRLWLINNQITEIPPTIGQLVNLKWLGLSNNQITEIPNELKHMPIKI